MRNCILTLATTIVISLPACGGGTGSSETSGSNDWDPESRTCTWGGMTYEEGANFGPEDGCTVLECAEAEGVIEVENHFFDVATDLTLSSQENVIDATCLTSVGGTLFIGSPDAQSDITDLSHLFNLSTISGDLHIQGNPLLPTLVGFRANLALGASIRVIDNDGITSLQGLEFVGTCSGCGNDGGNPANRGATGTGADEPGFTGGVPGEDGGDGGPTIGQVYGDFVIAQNDGLLETLAINGLGLIWGGLLIEDNPVLSDNGGLQQLADVSEDFGIRNNVAYETTAAQAILDQTAVGGLATICGNLGGDPC